MSIVRPLFIYLHSCLVTKGYLVCLEQNKLDLYHTPLSSDKPFSLTILSSLLGEPASSNSESRLLPAASSDNIWVQIGNTYSLLDLHSSKVSVVNKTENIVPLVGHIDSDTDVVVKYERDRLSIEVVGDFLTEEYVVKEIRGKPVQVKCPHIIIMYSEILSWNVKHDL